MFEILNVIAIDFISTFHFDQTKLLSLPDNIRPIQKPRHLTMPDFPFKILYNNHNNNNYNIFERQPRTKKGVQPSGYWNSTEHVILELSLNNLLFVAFVVI